MKQLILIWMFVLVSSQQGCGLADPQVVYDESVADTTSQDAQVGAGSSTAPNTVDEWSKAHEVFAKEMSGVVRSYCVNCHSANHSVPFKAMTDGEVCDKLETMTSCDATDFKNFLQQEHPGGNISKKFAAAIEERFRADACL